MLEDKYADSRVFSKQIGDVLHYKEHINVQKNILESKENQPKIYKEYHKSLGKYFIKSDVYTNYLMKLFSCLSAEMIAQNKPYKLYIDSKEFEPHYVWGKQTVGYLFDLAQKGPNISISYILTTSSGNLFHMFPKIIVNPGFSYISMAHGINLEVSKIISGHGISWKLDVETHKAIRELKKNSYSWMKTDYLSSEIAYNQHIYFDSSLVEDLIRVFDNYYRVFGKNFEKLRELFIYQDYRFVNENLVITGNFSNICEMRLYHDPFTDV